MVRGASLFGQLLGLFPRIVFEGIVKARNAERGAKGFTCWTQFVAMLFCQVGQAHSLREICGGLRSVVGKRSHLGIQDAPKRSTLSYANEHRPWEVYQDLFYDLLVRGRGMVTARRPLRFKNKLLSLDATVIDLCLSLFPWAEFRQTKGAVKLHLLLDHEGYLPVFATVTEGKRHEITVAKQMRFPEGSIVVFDMGYCDYAFFGRLCSEKAFFVTRQKDNALYDVIESRPVPTGGIVLSDEVIRLSSAKGLEGCPFLLRRVVVQVPDKEEPLVLLTNHMTFAASTVAAIYKERWQIELFFKAIKQNLRVKTFVGTSRNALLTQIWTALIAILLLKILALKSRMGWALSTLACHLRWNLFSYKDLWQWIDDPYTPPQEARSLQPRLFDSVLGQQHILTCRGASS